MENHQSGRRQLDRVIKCDSASDSLAGLARFRPMEVLIVSGSVDPIEDANRKADIIIRTARAEAQTIEENARSEGYASGIEKAAKQAQELIARLETDIASLDADKQAILDAIEPDALKLCIEVVEKIIRHEIRTDPKVVQRVVKSCLRRMKNTAEARIRVNPAELAAVRAQRDELLGIADGLKSLSIVDDRRISPGGCVVETSSGDFDATVETQLDRIDQKLGEIYEDGHSSAKSGEV